MPITHTNRRGQLYYLHTGTTKAGKQHWYMSTKSAGQPADAVPDGYEIWEEPADAQVFIRKIPAKLVTDEEEQLVRRLSRTLPSTKYIIVDTKGRDITVYSGDIDPEERSRMLSMFGKFNVGSGIRFMEENMRYHEMLQFTLLKGKDADRREFSVARWCFRGSIDGWFHLSMGPLDELARKYLPHVGAKSFFELM